jgi:hypothetical protein
MRLVMTWMIAVPIWSEVRAKCWTDTAMSTDERRAKVTLQSSPKHAVSADGSMLLAVKLCVVG